MTYVATAADRRAAVERLTATKRRGAEWLLARVGPAGEVGPRDEGFRFYRLPWTLAVSGHSQTAAAVCGWIREHMLTPEGDFDRGHRRLYDAYAYRNATLVYGAHMARQFDLSSRGLAFILEMQDQASGGFANDRAPDGTLSDVMDLPYTCGCGLACLALGRLDAARKVYRFLERVWNAQADLPERLYYSFSRSRQTVITEYDPRDAFWHIVESQQPRRSAGRSAGWPRRSSAGCIWSIPTPPMSRWRGTFNSSPFRARLGSSNSHRSAKAAGALACYSR